MHLKISWVRTNRQPFIIFESGIVSVLRRLSYHTTPCTQKIFGTVDEINPKTGKIHKTDVSASRYLSFRILHGIIYELKSHAGTYTKLYYCVFLTLLVKLNLSE